MLGIAATVYAIVKWVEFMQNMRGTLRIVAFVGSAVLAFLWFRQYDKKKKQEAARKASEEAAWEESVRLQAREELKRSVTVEEQPEKQEEYYPETKYFRN